MNIKSRLLKDLGWKENIKWNYELAKERVSKYSGLIEWMKEDSASYQWAVGEEVQRKIADELGWVIKQQPSAAKYWNYSRAKEEARAFSSLGEWFEGSPNSYKWACKKKLQRQIARELGWQTRPRSR